MNGTKSVLSVFGTVVLLCLAVAIHAAVRSDPQESLPSVDERAIAVTLTAANFDAQVPTGKEVDAIHGDVSLRNGLISVVIGQPLAKRHANMTVKDVAGAIIDLSVRGPSGGDQLAAYYPGRKAFPFRSVSMVAQPGKNSPADSSASVIVKSEGTDERPEVTVTYELLPRSPFLTVISTITNRSTASLTAPLEDDFRADGAKEDMVRTANGKTDRFWLYDRFWGQAYGLDAEGYSLQVTSNDAKISTIKYENANGETSVTLSPGQSFTLKRRLYPGGNIFDVHATAMNLSDGSNRKIVRKNRSGISTAGQVSLELSQGANVLGAAPLKSFDHQDELGIKLADGDYSARLLFCGNPVGSPIPLKVTAETKVIELTSEILAGRIEGAITDGSGSPIPCKVELKPLDEDAKLDFGPETAAFQLKNLIYTPNGQFAASVPAGRYSILISHGPEFDTWQTELNIAAGGTAPVKAQLVRAVDTTGWVSGDFHSHSSPSGDNTSSQLGRVLNLVCEQIEFAPCTEHNRVSTYGPHIQELNISQFMSTVSGIELTSTPLPLNHQNAFPMKYTPRVQDGGGPVSGPDLESQIERLALWDNRSEKLLQVNHPDVGWMFYDKDGDGTPDAGYERAFPFMDVMEIHPINHALHLGPSAMRGTTNFHNTVFNWLQLLNQGYRIYGVVNTDAHYNFHGSGSLRNWIQSSTDEPSKIDVMEMVHAAEQGRVVMSNGPFLEVIANEPGRTERVVSGQDLKVTSGRVSLKVRVQCANWLDVNSVVVLINGRPHHTHQYSRDKNPDAFRSGVVKFERTLEVELKGDTHLIVVTGNVGGSLGRVHGPGGAKIEPTAISNPIFVDVDGNGFQANRDTLGAPLPVKHLNSK